MKKLLVAFLVALVLASITSVAFASGLARSGKVVFGTGYKKTSGQLVITHKQDSFSMSKPKVRIFLVAYLTQTAKSGLKDVITEVSPKAKKVASGAVNSKAYGNDEIENDFTVSQTEQAGMKTPGTYQFAYYQGSKNIGKGKVTLTK